MSTIARSKSRRCPAGSRRVKGTNSCQINPGGLKFANPQRNPKRKVATRKIPFAQAMTIPFAQARPMGRRTNVPMQFATYDLGLPTQFPTQFPTPIAYANMPRTRRTVKPRTRRTVKPRIQTPAKSISQLVEELD